METSHTNEARAGIKPGSEIILGGLSLVGSGIYEVANLSAEVANSGVSEFTAAGIVAGLVLIWHGVKRILR